MNHSSLSPIIHPKHFFLATVLGFFIAVGLTSVFGATTVFLLLIFVLLGFQLFIKFPAAKWLLLCFVVGLSVWYTRTFFETVKIQSNLSLLQKETHNFLRKTTINWAVGVLLKTDDSSKTYLIKVFSVGSQKNITNLSLQLRVPLNSFVKPGDLIVYISQIQPILPSDSFAFDKYFQSRDIYGSTEGDSIEILDNTLSWYDRQIVRLGNLFSSHISAVYTPNTAALLWGLLFWERQNLDKKIDASFKLSGLSHIIAVSGFNITILIVFCTFLFRSLPVWIRISVITLVVLVFLSLVGEQISALRAAIMWLVGYYAISFGKQADVFYILLATALFFVFLHPYTLNYDVSFHLSFLAVIWMLYTSPFFKKLFSWAPDVFWVKEALIATLWALSFTFPVSLISFWQLPLLTPFANILVTPLIPLTMLLSFVSLLADIIHHSLGVWFGFLWWWLLEYILFIARFFSELKKTILQVNFWEYSFVIMSGYYLCLVYWILHSKITTYTSSSDNPSIRNLSWESINEA